MFQGYTQNTIDFMWGIRFNNERDWFMAHKEAYLQYFLAPTKALGEQVYDALRAEFPDEPLMLKVSRIYRDARRLHGHGPYKDNLWWTIRTGDEDWTGKPTFWFEITPELYSYGLGFWAPKAAMMEAYRREIDRDPETLSKLVRQFNQQGCLRLTGEEYSRPKGNPGELLYPWYQKKNVALCFEGSLDENVFSPQLANTVLSAFRELMPFYVYFSRVAAAVPQGEQGHRK